MRHPKIGYNYRDTPRVGRARRDILGWQGCQVEISVAVRHGNAILRTSPTTTGATELWVRISVGGV